MQPLVAFVMFFRDDQMVFETMPPNVIRGVRVVARRAGGVRHLARRHPDGALRLQVSILEPVAAGPTSGVRPWC